MRFLTIFFLLAIFACKNKPAQNDNSWMDYGPQDAVTADTSGNTGYAYTFTDTILVSINAKDYAAVLKEKPNMPILDLRPESDFKKGHVWRSVSMDANDKDFMKRLLGMGRNQEYAVYCQTGQKSLEVAEEMKRQGFMRIYHLQKGLNFWGDSGQALQLK
jgi:rhodanese-related sulfurtransferase